MGYSCNAAASLAKESLFEEMDKDGITLNGNAWKHKGKEYFFEQGREQADGAITGTVWAMVGDSHCKRAGSARIEKNGLITRFPCVPREYFKRAEAIGAARFIDAYGYSQATFEGILIPNKS